MPYIVHENTITLKLGDFESEDDIKKVLKQNYSALLSLIELDNVVVEVDLVEFVFPLTVKDLTRISGLVL